MTIEERLRRLGLELPPPPKPVAAYAAWTRVGNLIFTSGQIPWVDGELHYIGKLGRDLTVEDGYQAARISMLNALAQLDDAAGGLNRVKQIARVEGYVNCAAGFYDHPRVLDGASDLINELFGERGAHARVAVGGNEMPLNVSVEIVVIAEASDDS